MAYKINGTDITIQPETGHWVDRESIGRDGNGRNVYVAPREFELKWGLISISEWSQLRTFFGSVGATGTAVVTLPKYSSSSYAYYDYSGCILNEPTVGEYFEEFVSDVRLVVSRVIT